MVFNWSARTTRAVVRTYQRARPGDRWRLVRGPMPARVGYNGFSANRHEGAGVQEGKRHLPAQQTGGPTAGCVSLRPKGLVAVLRWIHPGTRIAMGPAAYLNRL